jgi:hypothetical protein
VGKHLIVPLALLAVAVAAGGCGGGSAESSADVTISKTAFVKKADAVCAKGNKRMEVVFARFLKAHKDIRRPDDAVFEKLVGTALVPNIKREIRELRALGAPADDEDRVDDMITALEEGVETAEGNPQAAVKNSEAVYGISSRLAKEYGLEVCGSR